MIITYDSEISDETNGRMGGDLAEVGAIVLSRNRFDPQPPVAGVGPARLVPPPRRRVPKDQAEPAVCAERLLADGQQMKGGAALH